MVFFLQRERVFYVNICVLMRDCYFGLLILLMILFRVEVIVEEEGKDSGIEKFDGTYFGY